ncbi:hypothetical protein [Candidatus Coxiella mudrowiae]|uniref:hypothetical protein n=1 Tax=Candidatus Coxiella mudrowiae TaxID=2054173 RepID=UPI000A940F7F|nr:hypothetical protein [Candidatus Coxiella mudrowiae]
MMRVIDKFARHVSGTKAFAILFVIIVVHLRYYLFVILMIIVMSDARQIETR